MTDYEGQKQELTGDGTVHGWHGLAESRPDVEQRLDGSLRLQEERENGPLGVPPAFLERQIAPLETALDEWGQARLPRPASVTPFATGSAAVAPMVTAGVGSAIGWSMAASLLVGCVVGALMLAAQALLPTSRALARGVWLHYRVARLKAQARRADLRHTLAAQWIAMRRSVLLPTYDIAYARAHWARRLEDGAKFSGNLEGDSDVRTND